MILLLDNKDEYALFKIMAAQGKTDPEICDAFLQSHRQFSQEIRIHCDLPDEKEIDSLSCPIWTDEKQDTPFELSTPLDNFPSIEQELFPSFRDFLNAESYVFVVRTPDPDGDIMNFCRAPPGSKEITDTQDIIVSYMKQYGITEVIPTKTGLKIRHENGMIENIPFQTKLNLNYPFYQEEEEGAVLA